MPIVATGHERHAGRSVGDGHCVAYVRAAADAPHTSMWRKGVPVRGGALAPGTLIATFSAAGRYENRTDGASHAAILISENTDGLLVWDQWLNQPVHQRVIRFRGGADPKNAVNDGDQYFTIELDA